MIIVMAVEHVAKAAIFHKFTLGDRSSAESAPPSNSLFEAIIASLYLEATQHADTS